MPDPTQAAVVRQKTIGINGYLAKTKKKEDIGHEQGKGRGDEAKLTSSGEARERGRGRTTERLNARAEGIGPETVGIGMHAIGMTKATMAYS